MNPIYYATYIDWYDCPITFICYDKNTKYICILTNYESDNYAFALYPISDKDLQKYIDEELDLNEFTNSFDKVMIGNYRDKNSNVEGDIEIYETIANKKDMVISPGYGYNTMGRNDIIINKESIVCKKEGIINLKQ